MLRTLDDIAGAVGFLAAVATAAVLWGTPAHGEEIALPLSARCKWDGDHYADTYSVMPHEDRADTITLRFCNRLIPEKGGSGCSRRGNYSIETPHGIAGLTVRVRGRGPEIVSVEPPLGVGVHPREAHVRDGDCTTFTLMPAMG